MGLAGIEMGQLLHLSWSGRVLERSQSRAADYKLLKGVVISKQRIREHSSRV